MNKPKNIEYIEHFIDLICEEITVNYPLPFLDIQNGLVKIGNSIITNVPMALEVIYKLTHIANA